MERQVQLEHVTDAEAQALKNSMYHAWPGAVVTYNSSTQQASIQPMVNDPRRNVDTGQTYGEAWPILQGIPIAWMRAGGFTLSGILNPGDPVVLIAWDIDPTPWLKQGKSQPGTTSAVNPADVRRHGGGYWWALPCNFYGPIADVAAAAAGLVIGKDGDPAQIRIQAGSLQLGNAGTDHVALASLVNTELGKIATTLGSLTGAAFATPYTPSTAGVGSTLVKAQ